MSSWWWSFFVIPDGNHQEMQVRTLPLMHQNNNNNRDEGNCYYQQQRRYFRTLPASYVVATPERSCYGIVSDKTIDAANKISCWLECFIIVLFQAKKDIYNIKSQRLMLAQDEYNHLSNALATLTTSRSSRKNFLFFQKYFVKLVFFFVFQCARQVVVLVQNTIQICSSQTWPWPKIGFHDWNPNWRRSEMRWPIRSGELTRSPGIFFFLFFFHCSFVYLVWCLKNNKTDATISRKKNKTSHRR